MRDVSKSQVMKRLASMGIRITCTTLDGKRVWKLSNGQVFYSLHDIAFTYRLLE